MSKPAPDPDTEWLWVVPPAMGLILGGVGAYAGSMLLCQTFCGCTLDPKSATPWVWAGLGGAIGLGVGIFLSSEFV